MGRRMGVGIADGVAVCGGPLEVLWRRAPAIVEKSVSQHGSSHNIGLSVPVRALLRK